MTVLKYPKRIWDTYVLHTLPSYFINVQQQKTNY